MEPSKVYASLVKKEALERERLLRKEYESLGPTQDDVNEKLFEAIKLLNEKLDQKVREYNVDNKRIELAIDVMGARYCHDKDIVTARLNYIDEELSHTMGRLNNIEQVLEAIEFVQSNKKCNIESRLDVVEEECRNFGEMQTTMLEATARIISLEKIVDGFEFRLSAKAASDDNLAAKMAKAHVANVKNQGLTAEQINKLGKEQNKYNQCCK